MIQQARMRPLSLRRLTSGERALAEEMFGDSLDPARARLFALPVWRRAFVGGPGLIVWPAGSALLDFAAPGVSLGLQATFVHELAHVWQAQSGVNLLKAKLKAGDGSAAYAYRLPDGPPFDALNIEQQASMIEHAFIARRGGPAPYPGALYLAALADRSRSSGNERA